jgi:hypothetical protein
LILGCLFYNPYGYLDVSVSMRRWLKNRCGVLRRLRQTISRSALSGSRLGRAKARERKAIEALAATLQKKADDLAPPEPVPPLMIKPPDQRELAAVAARPSGRRR